MVPGINSSSSCNQYEPTQERRSLTSSIHFNFSNSSFKRARTSPQPTVDSSTTDKVESLLESLLPELRTLIFDLLDGKSLTSLSRVSKWCDSAVQKKHYVSLMLVDKAMNFATRWKQDVHPYACDPNEDSDDESEAYEKYVKRSNSIDILLKHICICFLSQGDKAAALDAVMQSIWPENKCFHLIDSAIIEVNNGDKSGCLDFLNACELILKEGVPLELLSQSNIKHLEGNLGKIYARSGDIDSAKKFLGDGDNYFWNIIILASIALRLAESGDADGAKQNFTEVKHYASTRNHSDSFAFIGQAQAQSGDVEGAKDCFAHALQLAEDFSDWSQILSVQARCGDINGAITAMEQITEVLYKDQVQSVIASELALNGEIGRAEELARQITDELLQGKAYLEIVKAELRNGQIAAAKQIGLLIKHRKTKLHATVEIVEAQIRQSGLCNETTQMIHNAINFFSRHLDRKEVSFQILSASAVAMAERGAFSEVRMLIAGIDSFYCRALALVKVASALQPGKLHEEMKWPNEELFPKQAC